MINFTISLLLVFFTAYFISAILAKGDIQKGFIYINLIAFGQIIVISELLSTFYKIQPIPFLILNCLFTITACLIWIKAGKPNLKLELKHFLKKTFNACKLDKSLFVLIACWIFFIFTAIILIILLPATSADAYCYHVTRSFDWVINQSLAHYETADIRNVSFPINSEILYMWIILFTKKQLCLGIFSFVGYLIFLVSSYGIFKHIGYSLRRTLWTLIIVSSFASVIVMISGTETDLIIAGLLTASIYLFINAVKNNSNSTMLFMSSMAYALAIGIKTPAIIAIPAIALLFVIVSFKFKDKFSLLKFIGFGIINFIIFSSYNYILNFIDFGNIMGSPGSVLTHKNLWGIKGFFANIIKHFFLIIDFSGIKIPDQFGQAFLDIEKKVLQTFDLNIIPEGVYSGTFYFNWRLIEPGMGCGILSILLILPCWLISLITPIFKKSRLIKIQWIFAFIFLVNFLILSYTIAFMTFNTRFLTTYILISTPMLACSYFKSNKNLLKLIYISIAILYFTVISTHLWGRHLFYISNALKHESVKQLRSDTYCNRFNKKSRKLDEVCNIDSLISSKYNNKDFQILFLQNFSEMILFNKVKQLQNYKYDFRNMEHLKNIDIDKYDLIIYPKNGQSTTYYDRYTPEKIDYFFNITQNGNIVFYPLNKNNEQLCHYEQLGYVISKELGNENSIPTKLVCTFTKKFYENHPFRIMYQTENYFILLNLIKHPIN